MSNEEDSRLFRNACLSHSTGTGGFRVSVTPQQQLLQISIYAKTHRLDASLGDDSIPSALIPFSCVFHSCEYTDSSLPNDIQG